MWDPSKYREGRNPGEYQKLGIRASTKNWESGRVPKKVGSGVSAGKVKIRASTGKVGSGRVPERWDPGKYWKGGIRASTGNVGFWRVPGRWDPGEYQEGGHPDEYLKWGIRASTRNVGSGRVPEKVGSGLENPKQAKRSKQTQGKGVGPSMTSKVCQQMT